MQLQDAVRANKADLGIAFDGDGDRIGVVDGQGRILWGDQLLVILSRDVLRERPGATIIADVKASQVLFDEIARAGGKPLMWQDRPFAHQDEDGRDRRAARRRDERPHLLRRPLVRLRRRALRGGAAADRSWRRPSDSWPRCATTCRRWSTRRSCASPRRGAQVRRRRGGQGAAQAVRRQRQRYRRRARELGRTAGGCCAPRTRRTCWWRAARRATRRALAG